MKESFKITSLSRDDIDPEKYPKELIESLTDNDMTRIASRMADSYCGCCYWTTLEYLLEEAMEEKGIKNKNK